MSEKENKDLYCRVIDEVFNRGNIELLDVYFSPDWVYHGSEGPEGMEEFKQRIAIQSKAFPDLHFTIEDVVAEGEIVAARWSSIGTHKGELMGVKPTGKKVKISGVDFIRFDGGKLIEDWTFFDSLGMMVQIGAVHLP